MLDIVQKKKNLNSEPIFTVMFKVVIFIEVNKNSVKQSAEFIPVLPSSKNDSTPWTTIKAETNSMLSMQPASSPLAAPCF